MTHYQVPREETSINFTNISEQVYCLKRKHYNTKMRRLDTSTGVVKLNNDLRCSVSFEKAQEVDRTYIILW